MDLGFETIGNATLICHDGGPVLATDPWLRGSAYFGSWGLSHPVPEEQLAHVRACPYLWISHGHPDHLSFESLEGLRDKEILLPDHYGGRIRNGLADLGFRVRVLRDGVWTRLSDRLSVCSIGDYYQDAVLLCDLGGRLLVNSNDAGDNGAGEYVREAVRRHDVTFLLALTGYGDADMINFHDEAGARLTPPAAEKLPLGPGIAGILRDFGIRYYVPFAAMHRYQRTDSAWANEYTTPLGAHFEGFESDASEVLPPFVRCDLQREDFRAIDPAPAPDELFDPSEFGDDWSAELEPGDREALASYLRSVEHLHTFLGFVNFRVGGRDNVIDVNRGHDLGLTFEVPRHSLMEAVGYGVFDDLLIGNFMKTTLHGAWEREGTAALYPDFVPYLAKFADNGGARTEAELRDYFAAYRRRGFFGYPRHEGGRLMEASFSRYYEGTPTPAG